jgi:molybdopterin molybdotransferase
MKSFEEAQALIAQRAELAWAHLPRSVESVSIEAAQGRVLASDISATIDVPGHDNSQMDGYAARHVDLAAALECQSPLPVSQRIIAGSTGSELTIGTVARIFTGASLPAGADTVVPQEAVESVDEAKAIRLREAFKPGQWVRRRAEDIASGQVILRAGQCLSAQAVGLAASVGVAQVTVYRPLKVACFFTGNELVAPGQPLGEGQIYNSNRPMIVQALRQFGCEVTDLGTVRDELAATRAMLRHASETHALILTCGGVSVGEEDHVKPALQAEGSLDVWQVAIKPGKPLALGRVNSSEFVGLPGNPVPALVTLLVLIRPLVMRLQGRTGPHDLQGFDVPAASDWPRPDKRREFLRARLNGSGHAELFPQQGSAVLTSTVWADGLIDVAPGRDFSRGDPVRFIPFSSLGLV